MLKELLAHPRTRGLDIDHPSTTDLRRSIVRDKAFLRRVYAEWYAGIATALPPVGGPVLELGSGAGFLEEYIPDLITSDVFPLPGVSHVVDAHALPFDDNSLRAVVMTNVLHHLPSPRLFLAEADRCIRPGGALVMVEPWVTPWSTLVYRNFHHEPFEPEARTWEFPESGPLSGANGALPWILFQRDRLQFEREFPAWRVRSVRPLMPFRYLLSGGVSLQALMPGWSFGFWRAVETCLRPWMGFWGMFARVVVEKRGYEYPDDGSGPVTPGA